MPEPSGPRLPDRVARRLVHRGFANAAGGAVTVVEAGPHGLERVANPLGSRGERDDLRAVIQVHDPAAYRSLFGGSVGLGRSYIQGLWDVDDLTSMLRILARNSRRLDELRRWTGPVMRPFQKLAWRATPNTRHRAKDRIAAHYDLSNDLFAAFLDESMTYSCAVWEDPSWDLETAQVAKLDRVCRKLGFQPGMRVLEIGTGWGSFAVHAAAHHGVHVTTTTISREQHAVAAERVRAAGVEHLVDLRLDDYRDLDGTYDRVVSIEMIEAVGWEHLPTYLQVCADRLTDDGAMLLQAIVIDDRVYEDAKAKVDFIKRFVFPRGFIPSRKAITSTMTKHTDLRVTDVEDISGHYARTLAEWRDRFDANWEHICTLGFDEPFRRLWHFYLAYCEAGFLERRIGDVQMVLAKPGFRGEPTHRFGQPARLDDLVIDLDAVEVDPA